MGTDPGKNHDMTVRTYLVGEGVAFVAGKPVPANREVKLSDREALYDLSLGRIRPARTAKGKADAESETDGQ